MSIDCIIPAHNEALTVAGVAKTCVDSGVFRHVLVVDDGSLDQTWRVAGVDVLRINPNGGKAEAMLAGVQALDTLDNDFAFFDADLIGFRPEIVQLLEGHFREGYDMVCGLQDHGVLNAMQLMFVLMTGQRFVKRWVLEELPNTCWSGYAIEVALNFVVDSRGGKTCMVPMPGVTAREKQAKVGFLKGWAGQWKMARQMRAAQAALEASGGRSCVATSKASR